MSTNSSNIVRGPALGCHVPFSIFDFMTIWPKIYNQHNLLAIAGWWLELVLLCGGWMVWCRVVSWLMSITSGTMISLALVAAQCIVVGWFDMPAASYQSVCLSVCQSIRPSVCLTADGDFSHPGQCHIIIIIIGVITINQQDGVADKLDKILCGLGHVSVVCWGGIGTNTWENLWESVLTNHCQCTGNYTSILCNYTVFHNMFAMSNSLWLFEFIVSPIWNYV